MAEQRNTKPLAKICRDQGKTEGVCKEAWSAQRGHNGPHRNVMLDELHDKLSIKSYST